MMVELIIGIGMGFIPFVDNFGVWADRRCQSTTTDITNSASRRFLNGPPSWDHILSRNMHDETTKARNVRDTNCCCAGCYHPFRTSRSKLLYVGPLRR